MDKFKVAVVGNRVGFEYWYVRDQLIANKLTKNHIIISGGAQGVDSFAQRFAKEIGAEIRIYYPDPDLPHPWRYLERDRRMVDDADMVIAFNKLKTGGTAFTVQYAIKQNKAFIEYMGDNTFENITPKTINRSESSQEITKGEQSEIKT